MSLIIHEVLYGKQIFLLFLIQFSFLGAVGMVKQYISYHEQYLFIYFKEWETFALHTKTYSIR